MILIERLTPKGRLLGYNIEGSLVARECSKCSEYKPISNYRKHSGIVTGFSPECKDCQSTSEARFKFNESRYASREKNKEKYLASRRIYRLNNLEKAQDLDRKFEEKHKSKRQAKTKKWRQENPDLVNEYVARRTRILKTQDHRITLDMLKDIRQVYKECSDMKFLDPEKEYCVDHIIPLNPRNKQVCGLHVKENLTILTKTDNSRKRDKFDGTRDNDSWRKKYE